MAHQDICRRFLSAASSEHRCRNVHFDCTSDAWHWGTWPVTWTVFKPLYIAVSWWVRRDRDVYVYFHARQKRNRVLITSLRAHKVKHSIYNLLIAADEPTKSSCFPSRTPTLNLDILPCTLWGHMCCIDLHRSCSCYSCILRGKTDLHECSTENPQSCSSTLGHACWNSQHGRPWKKMELYSGWLESGEKHKEYRHIGFNIPNKHGLEVCDHQVPYFIFLDIVWDHCMIFEYTEMELKFLLTGTLGPLGPQVLIGQGPDPSSDHGCVLNPSFQGRNPAF